MSNRPKWIPPLAGVAPKAEPESPIEQGIAPILDDPKGESFREPTDPIKDLCEAIKSLDKIVTPEMRRWARVHTLECSPMILRVLMQELEPVTSNRVPAPPFGSIQIVVNKTLDDKQAALKDASGAVIGILTSKGLRWFEESDEFRATWDR